jgi:hypothetical protein
MSVRALSHVWQNSKQKGGNLLVLLALADFADDAGISWAAVPTLAAKARLTDRQTQRVLRELADEGEILIEKRTREDGSATSNRYVVMVDARCKNVTTPKPEMSPGGVKKTPSPVKMSPGGDAHDTGGGDVDVTRVVTPASPHEPSVEPSVEPSLFCPESGAAGSAPNDPVVLTFPTVGKAKEWHLRKSKIAEYESTFPSLNVPAEMLKALQWAKDNPRQRKTPDGMPKFLGGWLARAQNRGGARLPIPAPDFAGAPEISSAELYKTPDFDWKKLLPKVVCGDVDFDVLESMEWSQVGTDTRRKILMHHLQTAGRAA